MKKILEVVMVIMGTLIGAGFASGREIYLFFYQFGYWGIIGIIISGILTASIIFVVLTQMQQKNIMHYNDLITQINPNHPKINQFLQGIVNSFLLISFFIMIAGFSAYIKQVYEFPMYFSSIIFVVLCYIVFQKNLQGMMKINSCLVPFLLCFIFYLGIKNVPYLIESKEAIEIETKQIGFFLSSILYTSYNSIILIPILVTMNSYSKTKKDNIIISSMSGIAIIVLSFCIYGLLWKGQFFVKDLELPLLAITLEFGKVFQYIYGFVIICSIFTSAISTGYSFLENISKTKKAYTKNLILISMLGIIISNIGFSNLVQILYPLFGILGLVQIGMLFYKR